MKRSTQLILAGGAGIMIGGVAANFLILMGFNFRIFPHNGNGFTITGSNPAPGPRLEAIFSDFAHKLRPPRSSAEIGSVMGTSWVEPRQIHIVTVLGGKIPVSMDDYAVYIDLTDPKDAIRCGMYVTLKGGDFEATEQSVCDFLNGKGPKGTEMAEFALGYPALPGLWTGRWETFTRWRITSWEF